MSHGKGGSMHIFTRSFFGGNGIVGAQVPSAQDSLLPRSIWVTKMLATFTMYGDGASNQGQVFEAFNMVRRLIQISFVHSTVLDTGQAVELAVYIRVREQQIWNGYIRGKELIEHEIFHPWRSDSRGSGMF